jgi:hypothetical protein
LPLNVGLPVKVPDRVPLFMVGDVRVRPATVVAVAPKDIFVEPTVMEELVKPALASVA